MTAVVYLAAACIDVEATDYPVADSAIGGRYTPGEPHPDRGLYAVWAGKSNDDVLALPFVKGGQVITQWADVEKIPGQYDFSSIDRQLEYFERVDKKATVQINGRRKPGYLFGEVPYVSQHLARESSDSKGTLMYWHPRYVHAYGQLVRAFASHLRQSRYRNAILGVRMNLNGLGTEQLWVPPTHRSASLWTVPDGATPGEDFSQRAKSNYVREILAQFREAFELGTFLFVRNNIGFSPPQNAAADGSGVQIGLMHTSSEPEPRNEAVETQYLSFLANARRGRSLAYAESWADSEGRHGSLFDHRVLSPAQWNYWRLLADLHVGVSFIAVYGSDLRKALPGKGNSSPGETIEREEFREAFHFADRYAGFHACPEIAPGAWVAFRSNKVTVESKQPIRHMIGDYTFLMGRILGNSEIVRNIGPASQRFGAWALKLDSSVPVRLVLDEAFSRSLGDRPISVRVTYLVSGSPGRLKISAGPITEFLDISPGNKSAWQIGEVVLPGRYSNEVLEVAAAAEVDPVVFLHMVEVGRL